MSRIYKYIVIISALVTFGCKKEHLQPDAVSETGPVSWISAVLDSVSVYYAAGENNYTAQPFVSDTDITRIFGTIMANPSAGLRNGWEIRVDNYNDTLSEIHSDLDSTFHRGSFTYEYMGMGLIFPGDIVINWYDEAGFQFSSESGNQSMSSFEITNVQTIIENGLTYKKVTCAFHCMLHDDVNFKTVEVKNGNAVLLFGGI